MDTGKIPVIPTEFGGACKGSTNDKLSDEEYKNNEDWEWGLTDWLNKKGHPGGFSWCGTFGSNDSGFIFQTWEHKFD